MQLDLKKIDLKTCWIKPGKESFIYKEVIDSTLDIALSIDNQKNSIGKIVICDNQLSGKGSYNKSWYSEPYKDLTFSIILGSSNNFQQNLIDETCETIISVLQKSKIIAYQKKPNDIYVMNKKIAGILLSNVHSRKEVIYQALSLGININSDLNIRSFDSKTKADHTSFVKELGKEVNREKILVDIIQSIDLAIQKQINL